MAWNGINKLLYQTLIRLAGEKYGDFINAYRCWKLVVGELMAEKSYPIKFEKKVLYVAVSNNTWMQELVLLKQSIIAKYRLEHGIEIKQIVFLVKS